MFPITVPHIIRHRKNFEMSQTMLRVMAIAFSILLAGCHRQADPPGDAPTGLSITPGEGQVVVTWDQLPGLTYWIFFQAGSSVTPAATGVPIVFDVQSPSIVPGLANATQYAFVMNATNQDSRAGPSTPVATAVTRLAGSLWTSGTPLGAPTPQNLNSVAFGAVPVAGINTSQFVAVGDSGSIFSGSYNYTSTIPTGVTAWTQATFPSIPLGFASKLSAVIYTTVPEFVALGSDGFVLTSGDSVTWTSTSAATPPAPSITTNGATMNGLALSPGVAFVAVGTAGSIFRSTDLITWNPVASNTMNTLFNVSFLNGIFIATGANGTLLTSTDGGITWNPPISIPSTTSALRGASFGTGTAVSAVPTYVVVGDAGTILTSTDGTSWAPPVAPPPFTSNLQSIVFGSRFIAVGQGGAVAFSDDGTNWQLPSTGPGPADLSAVIFSPAMYVAVGASGANAVSK
jgi:hypothetical protein